MIGARKIREKIKNKKAVISIIGLGYVGLPLALEFTRKGFLVYGYDNNSRRVSKLKRGVEYISDVKGEFALQLIKRGRFVPTTDKKVLGKSDIIIICVPTPLRKVKIPDISYIIMATKEIASVMKQNTLVILESTTYPGTCREVILPILKKARQEKFFLAFSPERIDPGNKRYTLNRIPKVVGGIDNISARLAAQLYRQIVKRVHIVSALETAEMVKILENTFRLINIALVNEFALLAHKLGINIWEVIKAAATKPFGFMPFYPGPGIGGHCIPVDPLYIAWRAKRAGFKTKMIDLALQLNRYMPKYIVQRIKLMLKKKNISFKKAKILVIGIAYKKDVKDLRESAALDILEILKKEKVNVAYYDPLIPYLNVKGLKMYSVKLDRANLKGYDCVVIVTDHSNIDYKLIQQYSKLVFDTRNVYSGNFSNVRRL